MAATRKPARLAAIALAALFALHSAITTSAWSELGRALFATDDANYSKRRALDAFHGLPVDELRDELDLRLPPDTPLALAGALAENDFYYQRLSEGLYPHRIEAGARHVVDLVDTGTLNKSTAATLLQLGPQSIVLRGALPDRIDPERPRAHLEFSPLYFLACLLGAIGLGALGLASPGGRRFKATGVSRLPLMLLAGAFIVAAATTLATLSQCPLPRTLLPSAGLLGGALLLFAKRDKLRPGGWLPRHAESWALAAFCLLMPLRLAALPVSLWDGRSIWLFNAKRIFTQGMFARVDLLNHDALWAHPDYPLLYPGWLSYFSSFAPAGIFDERMASAGIAAFAAGTLALLWYVSRRALGRAVGALFATGFFLAIDHATMGGYVDGALAALLAIELLAFLDGECDGIAWTAGLCAALLKAEGLPHALLVALVVLAVRPRAKRDFTPLFAFGLPLAHKLWTHLLGLDSILKSKTAGESLAELFPRLGEALSLAPALLADPGYTRLRGPLWDALAALVALAVVAAVKKKRPPKTTLVALAVAAAGIAFAFVSISLLPEKIEWFVGVTLDRLLLWPAAAVVLAPLLWLAAPRKERA